MNLLNIRSKLELLIDSDSLFFCIKHEELRHCRDCFFKVLELRQF